MASTFTHSSNVPLGTSRTLIYGPVISGTTVIVFSGTFANNDTSNKAQHTVTVERSDGSNYFPILVQVPVPWGGSLKSPKLVLGVGESLYGTADTASMIVANLEMLINS